MSGDKLLLIFILLVFTLASFGLTQMLVYGKIFDAIRPKHYFFHCSLCVGFWSGILLSLPIILLDINLLMKVYMIFVAGCISSGTSYALSSIFNDDGLNINLK